MRLFLTMTILHDDLIDAALELGSLAGAVANLCDHVEHNEPADPMDVRIAGQRLRAVATRLAGQSGGPIVSFYRERLRVIEARNVLQPHGSLDGPSLVSDATSWRDLQLVQI